MVVAVRHVAVWPAAAYHTIALSKLIGSRMKEEEEGDGEANRNIRERRFGSSRRSHLGNRCPTHSLAPWVSHCTSPRWPRPNRLHGEALGGVCQGRPQQSIPTERPAGVKSAVFGAKRPPARAVGGLMISVARLLVVCTRCAFGGGSTKCSTGLPATINTIGGGPVALD